MAGCSSIDGSAAGSAAGSALRSKRQFLYTIGGLCISGIAPLSPAFGQRADRRSAFRSPEGWIGEVEIARVHETSVSLKAAQWYPGIDRARLAAVAKRLPARCYDPQTDSFPLEIQSWLLRSMGRTILIEAGFGNDKDRPGYADADHLQTAYLDRLQAQGVSPADVDIVILSHLHVDHVGWSTRLVNGRWVPTFPKATYIWAQPDQDEAARLSSLPTTPVFLRPVYADSIEPVIATGLSRPVNGVVAIDENITLRPAPGHSASHLRIELRSGGQTAVFAGDLLHSPLQVGMWQQNCVVDVDPERARQSRHDLLKFCAHEQALLIPAHFPVPYVGRVHESGRNFTFQFGWR